MKAYEKKAILLISSGCSYPGSEKEYQQIQSCFQSRYPNYRIEWAYSSSQSRAKLKNVLSPIEFVKKFQEEGIEFLAVQFIQVVLGKREQQIRQQILKETSTMKVSFGSSLISCEADIPPFMDILLRNPPPNINNQKSLWLWIGHGHSEGYSNELYFKIQQLVKLRNPQIEIVTLEQPFPFSKQLNQLVKNQIKTIFWTPLFVVCGNHVLKEINGFQDNSWKSQLSLYGISLNIHSQGICQKTEVIDIWLTHLQKAINELDCEEN